MKCFVIMDVEDSSHLAEDHKNLPFIIVGIVPSLNNMGLGLHPMVPSTSAVVTMAEDNISVKVNHFGNMDSIKC